MYYEHELHENNYHEGYIIGLWLWLGFVNILSEMRWMENTSKANFLPIHSASEGIITQTTLKKIIIMIITKSV